MAWIGTFQGFWRLLTNKFLVAGIFFIAIFVYMCIHGQLHRFVMLSSIIYKYSWSRLDTKFIFFSFLTLQILRTLQEYVITWQNNKFARQALTMLIVFMELYIFYMPNPWLIRMGPIAKRGLQTNHYKYPDKLGD